VHSLVPLTGWLASLGVSYIPLYQWDLGTTASIISSGFVVALGAVGLTSVTYTASANARRAFHRVANLVRQARRAQYAPEPAAAATAGPDGGGQVVVSKGTEVKASLWESPEEVEVTSLQVDVFVLSQVLKAFQAQHDVRDPWYVRAWRRFRVSLWFLPQGPQRAYLRRVYGGKVGVSKSYRKQQRRLEDMYAAYNLQAPLLYHGYLFVGLLFAACAALSLLLVRDGSIVLMDDGGFPAVLKWVQQASLVWALALSLELGLCFLYGVFRMVRPPSMPEMTARRKRNFSWDSQVSTESIKAGKSKRRDSAHSGAEMKPQRTRRMTQFSGLFMFRNRKESTANLDDFNELSDLEEEEEAEEGNNGVVDLEQNAKQAKRRSKRTKRSSNAPLQSRDFINIWPAMSRFRYFR
jgi:hypothetical protein